MYAVVGLVRHAHFGSNAYDLGIFDQVVWHLSRFEAPASTVLGMSNTLGDHFSPIHVLFVPLSWLWPSAGALIVTQALALGASIWPVWTFFNRRLEALPAMLMAIAYGLFWGLQRAAQFDVHELAFAPVCIALMLLSLDRLRDPAASEASLDRARLTMLLSAAVLCLVKEDQIPLVAATMALWAWLTPHARDRKLAMILTGVALVSFGLVVQVVIPALSDTGTYAVGSAFRGTLAHPFQAVLDLMFPLIKWLTLAWWLLPFLLLPVLSPYGLLLVPLVLERFLSSSPNHWGTSFHYSAPLAPILAMAAGDALSRIAGLRSWAFEIAVSCVVLCGFAPGHQPILKLFTPSFYASPAFADTARRALVLIPADASVTAQSPLVPHLSRRPHIQMLRATGPVDDVDFVVAAMGDVSSWPFTSPLDVRARMAHYERVGYIPIFEEHGWLVLKRGAGR